MVIAHLSDLHLDTEADFTALAGVETAIRDIKPQIIVVSGDFTSNPNRENLKRVKDRLEELRATSGSKTLIVVPGNHDCRIRGLFGKRREDFEEVFPGWMEPTIHVCEKTSRKVAIFCFDSNSDRKRITLARGHVGDEELVKFGNDYQTMLSTHGEAFKEAFKIAILHHHPLPIPGAETGHIGDSDAFLGLSDAGKFMQSMTNKKVDLVLHGHKHHPFFAKIRMSASNDAHDLSILAAGSAIKTNGALPTFNVIKIQEQTVNLTTWNRSGGMEFRRASSMPIVNYGEYRDLAFENWASDEKFNFLISRELHSCKIKKTGDADVVIERKHRPFRSDDEILDEVSIPVKLFSNHSTYSDHRISCDNSYANLKFNPTKRQNGILEGDITFSNSFGSHSEELSYAQTFKIFNGFSRHREERERILLSDRDQDYFLVTPRGPTELLEIEIKFGGFKPINPALVVVPSGYGSTPEFSRKNTSEQAFCKDGFKISRDKKTVTLSVPKPLKNHQYGLTWDVPEPKDSLVPTAIEADAKVIRAGLLNLDTNDLSKNFLQEIIAKALDGFKTGCPPRANENYSCGLMVYDPKEKRLRFVAGLMPNAYWPYRLIEGQGIAGRSHKLGESRLYTKAKAKTEDYSSDPPPGESKPEVLFSAPIRYPMDIIAKCEVIGVFVLWSTLQNTGLHRLDGKTIPTKVISELNDAFNRSVFPLLKNN